LKAVDERVCPLVCGRGFVKKGDSCERVIVKRKTRRATAQNNTITLFPRTTARRGNAFNQIQNNRHMPPGVDSDGGQM
jgi:hypothetical protein